LVVRRVPLIEELARVRPDLDNPDAVIASGFVIVDGSIVSNPRSRVPRGCSIVVREPVELRGSAKLRAALDTFGIEVSGRVALDVGAAAGGFTSVLLELGARRVYAVDAGHGQLLGSLRQDARVVNLEATNVAELDRKLVPEPVEVVTVDVSYLSLSDAVAQLETVEISSDADLIGLVKPMFELKLDSAPTERPLLDRAVAAAVSGVEGAGWTVVATIDSPVVGAKGARELLLHGRRPR
jgi:23S rRNA (cytidine1920-2'-O)/16S rRNA (cytidine1409-2'-O)-methyltransferase